jgi:hypothetical protein
MVETSLTQPWDGAEGEILQAGGWHLNGNAYKGRIDSWQCSRLVVNLNTMEQSTVIVELAKTKWPGVDLSALKLYWLDANMENERLDNIGILMGQPTPEPAKRGKPAGNKYGAPAGTPEYYRAWRESNRDKLRVAQKKYHTKVMKEYKAYKEAKAAVGGPAAMMSPISPMTAQELLEAEKRQALLDELFPDHVEGDPDVPEV